MSLLSRVNVDVEKALASSGIHEMLRPRVRAAVMARLTPVMAEAMRQIDDHIEVNEDKKRLVRELDVIWNGEEGAAKQASLCDLVCQIATELPQLRGYALRQPPVEKLIHTKPLEKLIHTKPLEKLIHTKPLEKLEYCTHGIEAPRECYFCKKTREKADGS